MSNPNYREVTVSSKVCLVCGVLVADREQHALWHKGKAVPEQPPPPPQVGEPEGPTFKQELAEVINRHSMEGGSNTPNFILADFLGDCLAGFEYAVRQRNRWYGRKEGPE
jgi:hypothetical protein